MLLKDLWVEVAITNRSKSSSRWEGLVASIFHNFGSILEAKMAVFEAKTVILEVKSAQDYVTLRFLREAGGMAEAYSEARIERV